MGEPTIAEIRARAAAATPGPWHWSGNTQVHMVSLMSMARHRPTVMAFFRWGMQRAKPSFSDERNVLTDFEDQVVYQVAPGARKGDKSVYREDFFEIDHPDAQFIAHAREDVDVLLRKYVALSQFVETVDEWLVDVENHAAMWEVVQARQHLAHYHGLPLAVKEELAS